MAANTGAVRDFPERAFKLTRTFNAPRAMVWQTFVVWLQNAAWRKSQPGSVTPAGSHFAPGFPAASITPSVR